MAQAVSDLSAANAPSLALWNRLSALYNVCEVLCATVVCLGIQGRKTKLLRVGIYLFAAMEWVSVMRALFRIKCICWLPRWWWCCPLCR